MNVMWMLRVLSTVQAGFDIPIQPSIANPEKHEMKSKNKPLSNKRKTHIYIYDMKSLKKK